MTEGERRFKIKKVGFWGILYYNYNKEPPEWYR